MSFFDFVALAGGLALFLYGMTIMGNGLEKVAGGRTESILQKLTSSTFKGVAFGAVVTALIQSSSGTTVIIIGLVNSGIMQLQQAVGVIMGANIGTTVTAQLLRLTDITGENFFMRLLKPSTLAPAIAFVGMLFFVFMKSAKKKNIGQILLGFGILFTGMFAMEGAVLPLRDSPLFIQLFSGLSNPLLGVLAGALVTAVIQSSSASVGILQALTVTGAVTWGSAIPIILGQNIGTCATGLIASIGASRAAKRVAYCHLYFNILGSALFIAIIYTIKALIGIPGWDDPVGKGGVANFHTLFNVAATLVFLPFAKLLVRLSEMTVRDKPGDDHPELEATLLDERLYTSPSVAIAQARKAVEQMANIGRMIQKDAVSVLVKYDKESFDLAQQREDVIDKLDVSITNYLVDMNELDLSEYESREVTTLLTFVTEYERIGDYAINVVERGGEVFDKEIRFSEDAQRELNVLNDAVGEIFDLSTQAFVHSDTDVAARVEPLEETIDSICETLRERHIDRLKNGQCYIEAGIVFLEVLTDYERISDHCSNIAARLLSLEAEVMDPHELRRNLHSGGEPRYNEMAQQYRKKYFALLDDAKEDDSAVQLEFSES
ncbi:Na/Pi cotransporter family protein [Ruminococcaceae bacterium OttesenSCG-928-I18]|nr:Na/Pi cotransporter family protein [Ruminococcaceae bacterium OttesenSCG-928-I18]